MRLDRQALEELVEAYALDLLDAETRHAVTESLGDHADLQARVSALQATVAALGYPLTEDPPPRLQASVLDVALRKRHAGRERTTLAKASPAEAYRAATQGLREALAELTPDEWAASTCYDIPVAELISHLAAVEQYTGAELGLWPMRVDPSSGHVAMRDPDWPESPADRLAVWWDRADTIARHVATLDAAALDSTVELHGIEFTVASLLVARTFELWTHMEDVDRAAGRPLHQLDGKVLHAMADQAAAMLPLVLAGLDAHRNKTLRMTLTGSGGGSWAFTVEGVPVGVADGTDATIVADTAEFCRLLADRVPPDELVAERIGDASLLDDLVRVAPALADYGERFR